MDSKKDPNFIINIATVNGSGSQTANTVLLRSLFRCKVPVGGKNVFPSNISGMPTWFWIRANEKGFVGAKSQADIVMAFNSQTMAEDQKSLKPGGFFFYPQASKALVESFRPDIIPVTVPFQKLADGVSAPPKIKKLASNMIYVGMLSHLLRIPSETVKKVIQDLVGSKASALNSNLQAFEIGENYAQSELASLAWPFQATAGAMPADPVLMDGNTAAALGLVSGGCQFVSWYPITPSTSVVDGFSKFAEQLRKDSKGQNKFAVVQSEDELAAFSMVLGAGWAGARAMTATSGPGLSLMAEGAGYAYYAEIPSVIWNVQRLGPSTGLPTRTAQGDVLFSASLSHGDTKHILLIPGNIQECFEFGQTCFDLAERLQQLVIVLSDLDLGMNLWMSEAFKPHSQNYDRGKIWSERDFVSKSKFNRYEDEDSDGIAFRTLPGNSRPGAAYFTRGSGHNFKAQYSEKGPEYQDNMQRLEKKWETAKTLVPKPIVLMENSTRGLLYYGSTEAVIEELCSMHPTKWNLCRLRSYPFSLEVEQFLHSNEKIYIIEQNRDAQMKALLVQAFPKLASKLQSILHFDGTPITADCIFEKLSD